MQKLRLDNALVEQKFAPSRAKAQAMIMAGVVLVNAQPETRADRAIKPQDIITLKENPCPYVSRGGLKLKAALDGFKIDVKNKICADIGVATGGFSHCMLLEGAKEVYGIDVGKGQLASEVAAFKNFIFRPQTNARFLRTDMFPCKFEVAAVDVSFISLKMIMRPLLGCMEGGADVVFLIKPQFELSPKEVPGGIVRIEENRQKALALVRGYFEREAARDFDARECGFMPSPVKGMHGNTEYLWHVKTGRI
ncbi:MAG: TlyA family RNA methyltransferase [Elusimicrobiota bacterium]|jgi:23S rRNA (cytidine1920-2'-O)/16S rRNA (cytidine1409-2'-O)-methyltransferase|nr:TlyA family RNA methyltransferase [Elusimicrobiota bacterium]